MAAFGSALRRHAKGAACQSPGRRPGPVRHAGQPGRREGAWSEAPEAIDNHVRISGVVENGVAALSAEDAGCARRLSAARHVRIIGHVQTVQAGAQGLTRAHQLSDGDGGGGLGRILQGNAERFSRFRGPQALIAFRPVSVVVDEDGVLRPAGSDEAGGDHGGIEAARQFCNDMAMARDQGRRRLVDDRFQGCGVIVPVALAATEGRRAPDLMGDRRRACDDELARPDRRQAAHRQTVGDDGDIFETVRQGRPVDADMIRPQRIKFRRRLRRGDRDATRPPPDAVQGAGGIPQQGERIRGVINPCEDISAPAAVYGASGDFDGGAAFADQRRQGAGAAAPVADQDMSPVDLHRLQARARTQPHFKPVDVERPAPASIPQSKEACVNRISVVRRRCSPIDQHIALGMGRQRRHRHRIGVNAWRRSKSSLRQTSSHCAQQWAEKGHRRTPNTQSARSPCRRSQAISSAER